MPNTSKSAKTLRAAIQFKMADLEPTLNKNTKSAYMRIWQDFNDEMYNMDILAFSQITRSIILMFLLSRGRSASGFNQMRSAVFRILQECVDSDLGELPKLNTWKRQIKARRTPQPEKLFLSKNKLLEARDNAAILFNDIAVRERNVLIFDIFMDTLIRADELALIQLVDINLAASTIAIRGKGAYGDNNGHRTVSAHIPISKKLMSGIVSYVEKRRIRLSCEKVRPVLNNAMSIKAGMSLFTSQKDCAMNVESIKRVVSTMLKSLYDSDSAVPKNHGPHCIRRSMAKHKYKTSGYNIVLVQKMLRHSSLETTRAYLGIDEDELKEAYLSGA